MTTYNPAGGKTYTLSGSISSTATTIILTSFLEPVTDTPYTMALLNTDIAYATISPKTSSSEFVSFTGITQNSDGTATLTGVVRGLAKKYPFTTDSAYKLPHSGQSQFILSDVPQVFQQYIPLTNDVTITGVKTFSSSPIVPTPTTATQAANKSYVDGVAIAGAPDSSTTVKGIGRVSVAPASATTPIFVGDNDNRVSPVSLSTVTAGRVAALAGNNTDIALGSGNLYVSQTGLQKNAESYAASAAGTDTYAVTLAPVPTSYVNGMVICFKADVANTGAATLNVNSLGAISIVTAVGTALATGDIVANQIVEVIYNSTGPVFELVNPASAVLSQYVSAYKTNSGSYTAGSGAFTIAHGLGTTPKLFKIRAYAMTGFTNATFWLSDGAYDGTTNSCVYGNYNNPTYAGGVSSTKCIRLGVGGGGEVSEFSATVDGTNVTLTPTSSSTDDVSFKYQWEVYK